MALPPRASWESQGQHRNGASRTQTERGLGSRSALRRPPQNVLDRGLDGAVVVQRLESLFQGVNSPLSGALHRRQAFLAQLRLQ